jgi:hypothetical protein
MFKKILKLILFFITIFIVFSVYSIYAEKEPKKIEYGVSFNTPYARELGLDWEEVYMAIVNDLKVKHLRLAAHWPMIMPRENEWNFDELDKQIKIAEENNIDVILAVGRRLPRWPECHVPKWAEDKTWEEQKNILRKYIEKTVNRYKDSPAIKYWQVENEPFLTIYAKEECGDLDKKFLEKEVELVKKIDKKHEVLITDSGNLGTWYGAYGRADVFGTSVYVYLWNEKTGAIETILPPEMYILKKKFMQLLYGKKKSILVELSAEPWLDASVSDTDLDLQFERMDTDKFKKILQYAKRTKFEEQYLWGAEWWYWLKVKENKPEFWNMAKNLYSGKNSF